jgi:hypothetical protein
MTPRLVGMLMDGLGAAVQNTRDRHSHADHLIQHRMFSRFGIRLISAYNGYPRLSNA